MNVDNNVGDKFVKFNHEVKFNDDNDDDIIFYEYEEDNNASKCNSELCNFCLSMLTPVVIMGIVYIILNN
jgi:hypothetical protein